MDKDKASAGSTYSTNVFCDTNLGSFHCAFEDLCFREDGDNCYLSAPFTADDDGHVFFRIGLQKKEFDRDSYSNGRQVVQVTLFLEEKLSFISVDIQDVKMWGRSLIPMEDCEKFGFGVTQGKLQFKNDLLLSGSRKIRVILTYFKVGARVDFLTKHPLIVNVASLLQNPLWSDVTLRANGKEYKLHKCILAATSSVFKGMFCNGESKEENEAILNIAVVNGDALEMMIKFIYSDDVVLPRSIMLDTLEELFFLANMYNIATLKKKCEMHLIAKLDTKNCVRLFNAATKFNAQHLQTAAKDVMSSNLNWLLGSGAADAKEFLQFVKDNQDVLVQITLEALANVFL